MSIYTPISTDAPCGQDLEYDADFVVLFSMLEHTMESQFGELAEANTGINWNEIEKICSKLLKRSIDIRLLIVSLRHKTIKHGLDGLLSGLEDLVDNVSAYTETIHPQIIIDGEEDPEYRANAFFALNDTEGFLKEFREVVFVSEGTSKIHLKNIEKALVSGKSNEAAVQMLATLERLHAHPNTHKIALLKQQFNRLKEQLSQSLNGYEPSFQVIDAVLNVFDNTGYKIPNAHVNTATEMPEKTAPPTTPLLNSPIVTSNLMNNRDDVKNMIQKTVDWLETYEPSSPSILLLRSSIKLIGADFPMVNKIIPFEILLQIQNTLEDSED